MANRETNFISAIVYIYNNSGQVLPFFSQLYKTLNNHFEYYELIVIDNACSDDSIISLKKWAEETLVCPLTIIHMSSYHSREDAMNAGIDAAIGDYVYEFDSVSTPYDMRIVIDAYLKAIEGNDIVCVCPSSIKTLSRLFYGIFNRSSKAKYKLQTDVFRLVTRRAINRVHASNSFMPYRKAAYAASGLRMISLEFEGRINDKQTGRCSLAIDSLALYTNAGFNISIGITFFMMAVALFELIYTLIIYCIGKPIEGWTTMMLVMTFGFLGLFIILSIVIRYLSLSLDMSFRKQKYLIESIEKIQK